MDGWAAKLNSQKGDYALVYFRAHALLVRCLNAPRRILTGRKRRGSQNEMSIRPTLSAVPPARRPKPLHSIHIQHALPKNNFVPRRNPFTSDRPTD